VFVESISNVGMRDSCGTMHREEGGGEWKRCKDSVEELEARGQESVCFLLLVRKCELLAFCRTVSFPFVIAISPSRLIQVQNSLSKCLPLCHKVGA